MSDQNDYPGMDHNEYIAKLKSDLAATSAERNAAAAAGTKSMADLVSERKEHAAALAEIAQLEAEAKAASMPDAQIHAAAVAIRKKVLSLLKGD